MPPAVPVLPLPVPPLGVPGADGVTEVFIVGALTPALVSPFVDPEGEAASSVEREEWLRRPKLRSREP